MKPDWDVDGLAVDLFECQGSTSGGATLLIEFETPLSIRETPVLVWRFLVQRSNVIPSLSEFAEVGDVGFDSFNRLLQHG